MSKKAVDQYYKEITDQYHEMLNDIKDIEADVLEGMSSPELLETLKKNIAPIKQNWERWTYMMFLLNKPNRKTKESRYKQANKKLLANLDEVKSIESTLNENKQALERIKSDGRTS